MYRFLKEVTSPDFAQKLESQKADPKITVLSYLMSHELFLEWAHSIGVATLPDLRAAASPVPPKNLRSIVAAPEEEVFLWTGARDIAAFMEIYRHHSSHLGERPARVLDFGCGCGRMTRFLDMASTVEAFGSDINAVHIAWCHDNLKKVVSKVNGEQPPLPFDDSAFDFVYSMSIFTHLDESAAAAWLEDLGRVVAPGGILILTTHGYPALSIVRDSAIHQAMFRLDRASAVQMIEELEQRLFVFLPYDADILAAANAGSSYGNTFIHPGYAAAEWNNRLFQIVEHIPGGMRGWQDVFVLKRN